MVISDAIKALSKEELEQKYASLISRWATLSIELGIVESLLEEGSDYEHSAMEYWNSTHDKLLSILRKLEKYEQSK